MTGGCCLPPETDFAYYSDTITRCNRIFLRYVWRVYLPLVVSDPKYTTDAGASFAWIKKNTEYIIL